MLKTCLSKAWKTLAWLSSGGGGMIFDLWIINRNLGTSKNNSYFTSQKTIYLPKFSTIQWIKSLKKHVQHLGVKKFQKESEQILLIRLINYLLDDFSFWLINWFLLIHNKEPQLIIIRKNEVLLLFIFL